MPGYQPRHDYDPVYFNGSQVNDLDWMSSGGAGVRLTALYGWDDRPDVRDTRELRSGQDGEYANNLYLGGRTVTVEGEVWGSSWANLQSRKRALAAQFAPSSTEALLKVPDPNATAFESLWSNEVDSLSPTAWWRLNDLASPPTSNGYDAAVLARGDTVALWKMDEASGSTADNAEGTAAYDLTLFGAPTLGATGPLIGATGGGYAIDYNGSSSYAQAAYSAALNPSTFTYAAWIYRDVDSGAVELLVDSRTGFHGPDLRITASDKFECGISNGVSRAVAATSTTSIATGRWYHLAATYDGTNARVYIDGVLEGTSAGATISVNTSAVTSICHITGGPLYFSGKMARLSLHNAALTTAEIGGLFVLGRPVADSGISGDYATLLNARTDLLATWACSDDKDASTLTSGTGNYDATITGSPRLGVTGPFTGSPTETAMHLDGANDYATVAYTSAMNPSSVTVAAWVKTTTTGTTMAIAGNYGSTGPRGLKIQITTGNVAQLYYGTGSTGATVTGTTNVCDGKWHLIVGTYSSSVGTLYVDGASEGTPSGSTLSANTSAPFYIGRSDGTLNLLEGRVAYVALSNAVWSASDVADLYEAGVNQRSYAGGMIDAPTSATGPLPMDTNAAFDFDGSNDAVVVPYNAGLNAATFSVAGWIKRDTDTGAVEAIMDSLRAADALTGWRVVIDASDKLAFGVSDGAAFSESASTTSITVGTWFHFACTYDGTSRRIYINGALETTTADAYTQNTTDPLRIGRNRSGTNHFPGEMDELAYFGSNVLTADQIARLYDIGTYDKEVYESTGMYSFERASCRVIEAIQFGDMQGSTIMPFQVVLRASDPRIYNDVATSTDSATTGTDTRTVTVDQTGTYETPPTLTVTGPTDTGIVVSEPTSGLQLATTGLTLASGDTVSIDVANRTINYESTYQNVRKLQSSLVAAWMLDETSGTTADNYEGTAGYDLTYTGGYTLNQDGPSDLGAVLLNGSTGYLNNSVYAAALNPSSFSFESWVNFSSISGTQYLWESSSSNEGWYLSYAGGSLLFAMYDGSSVSSRTALWTPTLGIWYHIAGSYNATSNTMKLYRNGEIIMSGPYNGTAYVPQSAGAFSIGGTGANGFNGYMAAAAFYDDELPAQTIADLYTADSATTQTSVYSYLIAEYARWANLGTASSTYSLASDGLGSGSKLNVTHRDARL